MPRQLSEAMQTTSCRMMEAKLPTNFASVSSMRARRDACSIMLTASRTRIRPNRNTAAAAAIAGSQCVSTRSSISRLRSAVSTSRTCCSRSADSVGAAAGVSCTASCGSRLKIRPNVWSVIPEPLRPSWSYELSEPIVRRLSGVALRTQFNEPRIAGKCGFFVVFLQQSGRFAEQRNRSAIYCGFSLKMTGEVISAGGGSLSRPAGI